jgi:glycolate oxidase FAD binding subunit
MTVTAQAGVTVSDVAARLAESGQRLPFDVALPGRRTIGGAIATRADSYRRFAYGSLRDALLGVDVLNDRGERVKAGGRVVKNVSGYDLPKLYCGSLGTLGLIVEATFRTVPIPEETATLLIPLPGDRNSEDALDTILGAPIAPSFLFLLGADAARGVLGVEEDATDTQCIVVGLDGAPETVAWQEGQIDLPHVVCGEGDQFRAWLRDFPLTDAPMSASFHVLSSQIGAFTRMVEWTARKAGFKALVVSDAALGMMWAQFHPFGDDPDWPAFFTALFEKASRCGGSFIVDRMPSILRDAGAPIWSPVLPDFALMQRIKQALDPSRMWNPGRFVAGL